MQGRASGGRCLSAAPRSSRGAGCGAPEPASARGSLRPGGPCPGCVSGGWWTDRPDGRPQSQPRTAGARERGGAVGLVHTGTGVQAWGRGPPALLQLARGRDKNRRGPRQHGRSPETSPRAPGDALAKSVLHVRAAVLLLRPGRKGRCVLSTVACPPSAPSFV